MKMDYEHDQHNQAYNLQCVQMQLSQQMLNNPQLMTYLVQNTNSEPRYVNAAQYHRIMIMRIKRARKQIQTQLEHQQSEERNREKRKAQELRMSKKYKYESRHIHAQKRTRGPDGKFIKNKNNEDSTQNKSDEC